MITAVSRGAHGDVVIVGHQCFRTSCVNRCVFRDAGGSQRIIINNNNNNNNITIIII